MNIMNLKKAIVAVALFLSVMFVPGWANETKTPVTELITTDVVVDNEPEFLVTTKNENGELVQTPVSELVTEPKEAPKVDSAEPIIPAVTTDTPVAELVVENEEPTPAPKPKKPEVPVDSEVPNIPAPVVEKPEVELPVIPAPVVEKPELKIPSTPAPKEEPKKPEPKTPVKPTPAPKEEPKKPEPKIPEVPTTPVVEEPVIPVASDDVTPNHTLRRLPLTGTEKSDFTAIAALLAVVAVGLSLASFKKEF